MLLFCPKLANAATLRLSGQPYQDEAVVPAADWMRLEPGRIACLTGVPGKFRPGMDIATLAIAPATLAFFRALAEQAIKRTGSVQTIAFDEEYQKFLAGAVREFEEQVTISGFFEVQGLAVHPPGLLTSTFNERSQRYIGLHVDSWDALPISQSHRARTRICLNLGREPRNLLFLPAILSSLDIRAYGVSERDRNRLVGMYFQRNPQAEVFRLSIAPGEAYLAPTDNIIHDGSSAGRSTEDYNINLRGFFALRE